MLQLLPTVLTLVGMLILVVALHGGVAAALTAWVAGNALTALVALAATRALWLPPDVPRLDDPLTLAIARLAILMGAVQVVNLFSYRTELFILNHYQGRSGVGVSRRGVLREHAVDFRLRHAVMAAGRGGRPNLALEDPLLQRRVPDAHALRSRPYG